MIHSWFYAILQAVRINFPSIRLVPVGDFNQLAPVCDEWSGDYESSSILHYLCNGNRMRLTHCRRSNSVLFDACANINFVETSSFPMNALAKINLAYTHLTRIRVNNTCMINFCNNAETKCIPRNLSDPKSQLIIMYVDLPLVCYKTKREKKRVILANSEIWLVRSMGEITVVLQLWKPGQEHLEYNLEPGFMARGRWESNPRRPKDLGSRTGI